jgi:hypothetical protein
MLVYLIIRIEAFELDEVIGVIREDELTAAAAHFEALQDEMGVSTTIILRPMETGFTGQTYTGQDIVFWGNKRT